MRFIRVYLACRNKYSFKFKIQRVLLSFRVLAPFFLYRFFSHQHATNTQLNFVVLRKRSGTTRYYDFKQRERQSIWRNKNRTLRKKRYTGDTGYDHGCNKVPLTSIIPLLRATISPLRI